MELVNQEVKFKYRFFSLDKYNRAMFEVDEPKLVSLYAECRANNKNVSLFYTDDEKLILSVSNFTGNTLEGKRVMCKDYKGSIRFYVADDWKQL